MATMTRRVAVQRGHTAI